MSIAHRVPRALALPAPQLSLDGLVAPLMGFALGTALMLALCGSSLAAPPDAKALLTEVEKASGKALLRALRDVEYTYTVTIHPTGARDVSTERHVFATEASWGRFTQRGGFVPAEPAGELVQGFDGQRAWAKLDGKPVEDPAAIASAQTLRKTNAYWFMMMTKLSDPGTVHAMLPDQKVGDVTYHRVKLTFGPNVGEAQDQFVLYVNPTTRRVDQFLFTALMFGVKEPMLMKVTYAEVDGFPVTAKREMAPADWEGKKKIDGWYATEAISEVRFRNGFPASAFSG